MIPDDTSNSYDPLRDLRNLVHKLRTTNGFTEDEILMEVHKGFDRYEYTTPVEVLIARMRTRLLMEGLHPHNVESILSFTASGWED